MSKNKTEMQIRKIIEVFPHSNNTRACVKVLKGEKENFEKLKEEDPQAVDIAVDKAISEEIGYPVATEPEYDEVQTGRPDIYDIEYEFYIDYILSGI